MELELTILNLNEKLLKQSDYKYDLSNFNCFFDTQKNINGIADVFQYPNLLVESKFEAFIDDDTRAELIKLLELLKDNPKALEKTEKILTREILYLGAECEELGQINIEKEYKKIEELLTNKYLSLKKVTPATVSKFITDWYEIKPKIIFISCHGDKHGLFLKDEADNCMHYGNIDFYNFFKLRSEYTECVLLSSCESLDLGNLIADDGKNVVCINTKVDIQTATKYTNFFFEYINNHSLENSNIYMNAHNFSNEIIQFQGLKSSFSFEFIKAKKIF
jgi:hypothetical protein